MVACLSATLINEHDVIGNDIVPEEACTELFDVLDCRGVKTGELITRDEAHRTGVWHGAFHCLIVGERNGRGYALFQRRSILKIIAPGKLDVSVGGHYATCEDAAAAGPREIREELGIEVRYADLIPIGRRVFVYCFTPGVKEFEFQDIFLLPRNIREEEAFNLQAEELDGVIFLDVEEGISLLSGQMQAVATALFRSDGRNEPVRVSAGDFVPCLDNYYLKLLLLARRFLKGDHESLII